MLLLRILHEQLCDGVGVCGFPRVPQLGTFVNPTLYKTKSFDETQYIDRPSQYTQVISSCNRTESSTITEEIQTSKFKAKKLNEPLGQVLIFALNLRV